MLTLKRAHITNTFGDIRQLVGGYIFVAATVLTEDGKKAGGVNRGCEIKMESPSAHPLITQNESQTVLYSLDCLRLCPQVVKWSSLS